MATKQQPHPPSPLKHVFEARRVPTTDATVLWEVVAPRGERIAESHFEGPVKNLALALNVVVTNHCAANPDLHA
jgi:hypothetical protein